MNISKITFFLISLLIAVSADCADLPGTADPMGIKRYEGSEIVRFEELKFDRFQLPLGKMTKFDFGTKEAIFETSEMIEGHITRTSYRVPDPLRSSFEVYNNYLEELKASGWEISWKASGKTEYGNAFAHIYESLKDNDQLFTYNDSQGHVLVASKPLEGLRLLLFVTKFEFGLTRGLGIKKGEPIVQLDLIRSKQMDQKMVVVTSTEMRNLLGARGSVALYGILFDFNQASIKPESNETLSELAQLLNEDPELKVLVVGHTDSVGSFESNRDLSDRRASAVINFLAEKHSVSRSRLRSFGVSYSCPVATNDNEEGRAKNRRVEIVKDK